MTEQTYLGGCLCGRIRYRATGAPHRAHYCHCRMCQRAVGAPLPAWVNFRLEGFVYLTEEPTYFRSSPDLQRGFCPTCGTSTCTIAAGDADVCITLASLDEPERIAPAFHMWTGSQMPWLRVDDDLPHYEGQG